MKISSTLLLTMVSVSAFAQYRPGQTFTTQGNNQPQQQQQTRQQPAAAPQQQRVNYPVYATPAARQTAAPNPAQRSAQSSKTSPYNLGASSSSSTKSSAGTASQSTKKSVSEIVEKKSAGAAATTTLKKAAAEIKTETKPKTETTAVKLDAPPTEPGTVITRHRTGKKLIALTYDDGPTAKYTMELMTWLKENNVPATFYLCGNRVKENPTAVKTLAENGFELANHTYDHPLLPKQSKESIRKQLQETHDLIKEASGVTVKTMRPPFGAKNQAVVDVCKELGYQIILWDVDTEDWRKRSTEQMMNSIRKLTGDGSIILMHDRLHGGKNTVMETTKQTVAEYRAKGYTFVTVTELLGTDGRGASDTLPAETASTGSALSRIQSNVSSTSSTGTILPVPSNNDNKLNLNTEATTQGVQY